ncbi:hypothetical protein ACQKLP_21900 [Chitinophaga sp. NPDC101104]|uniref:hypothetical protein n=1 Tax=Chitinophaga sp. NPDC101104 TaxID=3390561 RepID=UPI003D07F4BB
MDKLALLKEIWLRINSGSGNTPEFWKKIQSYSIYILLAIGAAFGLEWLEVFIIPAKLSGALIFFAGCLLGTGGAATATVKDPEKAGIAEESKYKPK